LRSGIEKNRPSNEYFSWAHIFLNSSITSSHISRVSSGSVMPKPAFSVVDDPPPVPNSKPDPSAAFTISIS